MSAPDWKDVLPAPPPGGRLHEAWMTSFDQPDAGLLVEHLLPSLLGTSYTLTPEVHERTLFFGELSTALEALHGRITVISSSPRGDREASQYPWLWRYVGHFTVGAESRAVQHSKLWAFHWKVEDQEFIELHVSSTNLTASAFKGQIQAGWQLTLPLGPRPTATARSSWGALIPFLDALGTSAGAVAQTRVQRLVTLLSRVACPADITFIASIPGDKSAARQLKPFEVSEIHVLTPTIGEWNDSTLARWTSDIGVAPNKVHLKWISKQHPWAESAGWRLSANTNTTLKESGVKVECLPDDYRCTQAHRDADARWSHAKLYLLGSGRKRRLLVTSANWSVSAWGAGKTQPRNFELGVVFASTWSDLKDIAEPFDPPRTIPFLDPAKDNETPSSLAWAEATWDGQCIALRARSTDPAKPIKATIVFSGRADKALTLGDGKATMRWRDASRPPLTVRFVQGDEALEAYILDIREPSEFAKTPLPEIDPSLSGALREAFLLQRYGGPAVDVDAIPGRGGTRRPGTAAPSSDYAVQAWADARRAFHVVDQWHAALDAAKTEPMLLDRVRLDGHELRALYARREGPAARLAAQELGWHIEDNV